MTRHTYRSSMTLHFHDGDEHDFDLVIGFDYVPGTPERGPSYASGGEPACGPEVDITSLRASRSDKSEAVAVAKMALLIARNDDTLLAAMAESAAEDNEPDPDAARDARLDDAMMERVS